MALPPLLRKFKHLLEGNYSKAEQLNNKPKKGLAAGHGTAKPTHLQMLDEQQSARGANESRISGTVPANSIKSQFEQLIT